MHLRLWHAMKLHCVLARWCHEQVDKSHTCLQLAAYHIAVGLLWAVMFWLSSFLVAFVSGQKTWVYVDQALPLDCYELKVD